MVGHDSSGVLVFQSVAETDAAGLESRGWSGSPFVQEPFMLGIHTMKVRYFAPMDIQHIRRPHSADAEAHDIGETKRQ
jgi:hypothetical protein